MANEQTTSTNETSKSGIVTFAQETQREIAKVTWPTRKEITVTTTLIVVFALVSGLFFLLVDSALGVAISHLLGMNS